MTSSPPNKRIPFEEVNGVLLLDKPVGPTSNKVLQQARRLCRAKKAGHTGTLDPMASGLLPICFGEATKFSSYALEADKTYQATLYMGVTTTTGDAEGDVIEVKEIMPWPQENFENVLMGFMGKIEQTPPMFSALKVEGKPLYEYARAGETIARKSRQVTIYALKCVSFDWPKIVLEVTCSKGTYIRTLAEDIGKRIGCGAHLTALRRLKTGRWSIEAAVTLDHLMALEEPRSVLHSTDELVFDFPARFLSAELAGKICQGQCVSVEVEAPMGIQRLYRKGQPPCFMGLGVSDEEKILQSIRLMRQIPQIKC